MYTVLITDDEKSIIESLKKDIPWANLGVNTILTANNGLQAMDVIDSTHVDMLITDIKMPHMDGLQLLKALRQHYPDIHCVLITAYGEFDYAMQALKLGVDNYLMKPIQIQELTETIENALDTIYIKRENRDALFRETILRRWITGAISSEELGEKTILTDINIYQPNYCVIAIKKSVSSVSLNAFGQECMKHFPSGLECSSVWDNSGRYIILVSGSVITRDELARALYQIAVQFDVLDLIDITIGTTVHDRNDVHISYQRACDLIDTKQIQRKTVRICSDEVSKTVKSIADVQANDLSPLVKRALKYISEHYAEGVSIKEFCNSLNINAAYLGYLFKKETGIFFNNYLNDFRMEKAIELLCNTGEKINDIAVMTGYITTSHFITTFKKKTGLSPLKYREYYGGNGYE